jgi:hypothetical protein
MLGQAKRQDIRLPFAYSCPASCCALGLEHHMQNAMAETVWISSSKLYDGENLSRPCKRRSPFHSDVGSIDYEHRFAVHEHV